MLFWVGLAWPNLSAVSSLLKNMSTRLSIANVDCFVLVIELRRQTGFRCISKTFETTLVRLFYLLSQCVFDVLKSKDQAHIPSCLWVSSSFDCKLFSSSFTASCLCTFSSFAARARMALCLWEPALVLKRLRVCRLREWLATRLRIPRSGITLPFLILMQTPACTGQAQIALWLSIANVDCFVLVIDLRWQTGFRWIDKTFETTLVRLFYLLSQCISNVLESKDQGADWYLGIVKVKKSINASNIVVDIKSIR